jgi:glycosyltransferase involved in cell wall biosynthesis
MRIAFVSECFSEGMGYAENMLPKALALLGHDVHVVASTLQVYGNQADYARNYEAFLGPAVCAAGQSTVDGATLHRLPFYEISHYIGLRGLREALREIQPDVVQFGGAAGLTELSILLRPGRLPWPVFTENHQHLSIAWRPKSRHFPLHQCEVLRYRLTRTWPAALAHRRVEKCFAVADDCVQTARCLYGIPREKIVLLPLGTDTNLFRPCESDAERAHREQTRTQWNVQADDILCVYTGRFTAAKNPLLLAQAVARLRQDGQPFRAVFVGEGAQAEAIRAMPGCNIVAFMKHVDLADIYRAADIAVWPSQESMSMLDAAASGLPLVVGERMGEPERVRGNGCTFREEDASSLAETLLSLRDGGKRQRLSSAGREKMVAGFSWERHAKTRVRYYEDAMPPRHSPAAGVNDDFELNGDRTE